MVGGGDGGVVIGRAVVEERDKWGTKLEVTFGKYMLVCTCKKESM